MSNRVIKDGIWNSPTLAKLSVIADLSWPRFLLLADDWGCFLADVDVIKGLVFPKRREFTTNKIKHILKEYNENGLLFLWEDGGRQWGFFVKWSAHQFYNTSTVDEEGSYTKHRRKTPEPPKDKLDSYLSGIIHISDTFRQVPTKSLNPIPNPNPIPNHNPVITNMSDFDNFYNSYPRKVAPRNAKQAWKKLNPDAALVATIMKALEAQKQTNFKGKEKTYIPHPATWLNGRRWEDEIEPEKTIAQKHSPTIDRNLPTGVVKMP